MRSILILIISFCTWVNLNSQLFVDKKGNTHLWGVCAVSDFESDHYNKWYKKYSDDYTSTLTKNDGKKLKDVKVKIFLGTWCGDTKYLLPKFIKAWDAMGLDHNQLELVALHYEDDKYKQSPNGESDPYAIHKVPTFVFEDNGKEIGRIVERTVFDLDTDISCIANKYPYQERYPAIGMLNKFISDTELDSLTTTKSINLAYKKVRREITSVNELNAYGYVLRYQNKLKQAEFLFLLNKKLYPYHPGTKDSYAELLLDTGRLEESKKEYYEVLKIKGQDDYVVKQLHKLEAKLKEFKEQNKISKGTD